MRQSPPSIRYSSLCALCVLCVLFSAHPLSAQTTTTPPTPITWKLVGPQAPGRVVSVAVDPRNNGVEYAAAPGAGILKTIDYGVTWTAQTDSLASLQFCSLALDPRTPDIVYAGTGDDQSPRPTQGVQRSADGGTTWSPRAVFTNQPVCALAVDSGNNGRIAAGTAEGTFLSVDSGASWTKILKSPTTSVAFDDQGSLYSGVLVDTPTGARNTLLARTADGGRTWTNISLPANPAAGTGSQTTWIGITSRGTTLNLVIAYQTTALYPGAASAIQSPASHVDFYGSTDRGTTWLTAFNVGTANPPVQTVIDASTGTLFITASTLLSSINGGATWQTVATRTSNVHSAGLVAPGVLLLGGEQGIEGGAGSTNPSLGQILRITTDAAGTVRGTGPGGLYGMKSGVSFKETGVAGVGPVGMVVAASGGSSNLYVSGLASVYTSSNLGVSFTARTAIPPGEPHAPFPPMVADGTSPNGAYIAGQKLYHTSDGGAVWSPLGTVDPDPTHVVIALTRAPIGGINFLYAATACLPEVALTTCSPISQIWRTTNNGANWTQLNPVAGYVSRLVVDPRQFATLYAAVGAFPSGASIVAGSSPGDILQSANGQPWTSIRGNLPKGSVNAVVIDPNSVSANFLQPASTLYVGTDAGVFVSFNVSNAGGELWTSLAGNGNASLPTSPVTDLVLETNGTLLASTWGRAIYSSSTTSITAGVIANPLSIDETLLQGGAATIGITLTNGTNKTTTWQLTSSDSWISLPESSGTLSGFGSTQIALHLSAAGLAVGSYSSRLQLTAGASAQNITVNLQVTTAPAKLAVVG